MQRLFLRIRNGDLGEDGLEPRSCFRLFAANFADLGVLVFAFEFRAVEVL